MKKEGDFTPWMGARGQRGLAFKGKELVDF